MRRKNSALLKSDTCCPRCDSKEFVSQEYSDTVDFRGLELDVVGLTRSVCSNCGNCFESAEQLKVNADRVRAKFGFERDRLRERDGLLSSHDIAQIRERFGLAQREAAILFGGGPNAFNKYESGEVLQSISMDRLLRLANQVGPVAINVLQAVVEKRFPALSSNSSRPGNHDGSMYVAYENKHFFLKNRATASKIVDVLLTGEYRYQAAPIPLIVAETGSVASGYLRSSLPNEQFIEIDNRGAA